MFFDPIYLLILLIGGGISAFAQFKVTAAFNKYKKVPASSRATGYQAARVMLDQAGLQSVGIERSRGGHLSDHYDPRSRVLRLSPEVHDGQSVASLGVACHEAGHAVQHATGYAMLKVRSALVPMMGVSQMSVWVIMIGLMLMFVQPVLGQGVALIGLGLFSLILLFQVVTLPVEFDASNRAKEMLPQLGLIDGRAEMQGVKKTLDAAALTYIAGAAVTLMQVLYFAHLILGNRR